MKITLKNYRCFPDSRPAEIEIRPGFTALVGTNNSGKSALLKFFLEFRSLFGHLSSFDGTFVQALRGSPMALPLSSIFDVSEIFCNANDRDLTLEFSLSSAPGVAVPHGVVITVPRGTNTFTARVVPTPDVDIRNLPVQGTHLGRLNDNRIAVVELEPYISEFRTLRQAFYVGPFRNAINVGTNEDYFDIQVGQAFIKQWRSLKTGNVKRSNELILRVTDDIARVFDFKALSIDASDDGQTLQVLLRALNW